jgi:hypothetical protein
MMIQIELWHLITLLLAFFGCVGAFGKLLLAQVEKRQAERFKALEAARQTASEHWDQRFTYLENSAKEWVRIERDFLEWKADLPMTYVMRDDYVRNQTVIEAKLDAIAVRQENILLKGAAK